MTPLDESRAVIEVLINWLANIIAMKTLLLGDSSNTGLHIIPGIYLHVCGCGMVSEQEHI